MSCEPHEFSLVQGAFICHKCGLKWAPKKLPDRDPEKPLKPLKGQKKLPLKK